MFEIGKTAAGYTTTPDTLATFNYSDGAFPVTGLTMDAAGDLVGATYGGGAQRDGTVLEVAKDCWRICEYPHRARRFNFVDGAGPLSVFMADAAGDPFGVTLCGSAYNGGTFFEIAKTASGYASTPTVLTSFNGSNEGVTPNFAGDLFGATVAESADIDGTVFEIAKTASDYASTPTVLASINGSNGVEGAFPPSLIVDANGDVFGTLYYRVDGPYGYGYGAVFEVARTASGYASSASVLAKFNFINGAGPDTGLIVDAKGDLFGTTSYGGIADDAGTVSEIAKTASGYTSTPTVLANFSEVSGFISGLTADFNGNLFGTTGSGGIYGDGTVFELTNTGYVVGVTVSVAGRSVTLSSSDGNVIVSGYYDIITDIDVGAVKATLTGLANTINLGDGTDTVTTEGNAGGSIVVLGNGSDSLTLATNNDHATLGGGVDMIALGGFNNTVAAGNGDDSVTGVTGHGTVTLGNGDNEVTLGGGTTA